MSQYSHLSQPDPELLPYLSALPPPGDAAPAPDVATQRRGMDGFIPFIIDHYKDKMPDASKYVVKHHTIPVEGGEISLRSITPSSHGDETFPVLVWYHGGGWFMGNIELDDCQLKIIAVAARISIVNVEYRLAPEHPFPTPHNDCYAALKWVATNAVTIRGALQKGFLVGGASAGGNLAAAMTHRARDDPFFAQNRITGQVLQIPALVHPSAVPDKYKSELLSYEQNKDAPVLSKAATDRCYELLAGPPTNVDVSPLLADHTGIPPAYIQICGLDPLRDEAFLYARMVESKVDVYPGVPHGFYQVFPKLAASTKWDADLLPGIAWLLRSSA
ncbi:Alpha/Beta hydrolase protein [Mycena crocata]|nr:Alpha/Beta hydrolase protein [Mycena crocata]